MKEPLKKFAPKNLIKTFKANGKPKPTEYMTSAAMGI